MTNTSIPRLSDRELLDATIRSSACERQATVQLLELLAELDSRRLYLGEGYPSLFAYCTHVLHLSESAAYGRITAARTTRRFPGILTLLADGAVTLTSVSLLAAHLTNENHETLLDAARYRSKRDIERLVASIDPQPDIPSTVRRLSPRVESAGPERQIGLGAPEPAESSNCGTPESLGAPGPAPRLSPARHQVIAPLAPERYLIKVTVSRETHARLERARDLLRHSIPNGDPAAILDRALSVLVEQLERGKHAATDRPRPASPTTSRGRHVPSAVKRAVWARDEGRCAFAGSRGRCTETGWLEFHHVVPFAAGGATTAENLELRCRSHNAYESDCYLESGSNRARSARSGEIERSSSVRTELSRGSC